MPVQETHLPKLCRHKAKNRAFVRLNGETIYCGAWGTAEARDKYDGLIRRWLDNGRTLPTQTPAAPLVVETYTVTHLCADYMEFAAGYYLKHGSVTKEISCLQIAVRAWVQLFPATPVDSFGPKQLKVVREEMIRMGHSRKTINNKLPALKESLRGELRRGR